MGPGKFVYLADTLSKSVVKKMGVHEVVSVLDEENSGTSRLGLQ